MAIHEPFYSQKVANLFWMSVPILSYCWFLILIYLVAFSTRSCWSFSFSLAWSWYSDFYIKRKILKFILSAVECLGVNQIPLFLLICFDILRAGSFHSDPEYSGFILNFAIVNRDGPIIQKFSLISTSWHKLSIGQKLWVLILLDWICLVVQFFVVLHIWVRVMYLMFRYRVKGNEIGKGWKVGVG